MVVMKLVLEFISEKEAFSEDWNDNVQLNLIAFHLFDDRWQGRDSDLEVSGRLTLPLKIKF